MEETQKNAALLLIKLLEEELNEGMEEEEEIVEPPSKRTKRPILKQRSQAGAFRLTQLMSEQEFRKVHRMNRQTFAILLMEVAKVLPEKKANNAISVEERLCITLR